MTPPPRRPAQPQTNANDLRVGALPPPPDAPSTARSGLPPSLAATVPLVPGMQASVLSATAADAHVAEATREVAVATQQAMTYMLGPLIGGLTEGIQAALHEAMAEAGIEVGEEVRAQRGGGGRGRRPPQGRGRSSSTAREGYQPSPASSGEVPSTASKRGDMPEGGVPGAGPGHVQRVTEMSFREGQGLLSDVGSLRQYAASRANEAFQNRVQARRGEFEMIDPEDESKGYFNVTRYRRTPGGHITDRTTGRFVGHSTARADEAEIAQFMRSQQRIGKIGGFLQSVAGGQGIGSSAAGLLGRAAGPVGLAYAAATFGVNQAVDQRARNAEYQQIYGGPNTAGFGQRLAETGFAWSQTGVMGGAQARELFKGTSRLGLRGDERDAALDFATDEFRRVGMSVADSIRLISISVQNGVTDFTSLRTALDEVAGAAREGGKNVAEAQRQFAVNYQAASAVSPTAQAPIIASALSSVIERQGQALGGVSLAGMLNEPQLRMMAARQGVNYATLVGQFQRDPAAAARALQGNINQIVRGIPANEQALREVAQRIEQERQRHGGELTQQAAQRIAQDVLLQSGSGFDPTAFNQIAAQYGLSGTTPGNAATVAVRALAGNFSLGDTALNSPEATGRAYEYDAGGKRLGEGSVTYADSGEWEGRDIGRYSEAEWHILESLGYAKRDPKQGNKWTTRGMNFSGGDRQEVENYLKTVRETGRREPVIEALLRSGAYQSDRRYAVRTAEGLKQVNLKEGMRHYADQFASGNVEVTKGTSAGMTVAQLAEGAGTQVDTEREVGSTSRTGGPGKRIDQLPHIQGAVKISATPELLRLLRFSPSGGAYLDDHRMAGTLPPPVPPAGDYPTSGSTGTGG